MKRPGQTRKQHERYSSPDFFSTFTLSSIENDPRIVKEAIDSIEGELWENVMEEVLVSLRKNETWDLVTLLDGRKPIGTRWIFK